MIGTILRLLRPAKPAVDDWQPTPAKISGPDDGELVGKYKFGSAWAEVRGKAHGFFELGDLYGDPFVPGRGTALLQEICRRADELGCTLSIQVVPPFERRTEAERGRLRALYADYGFAEYPGRDPDKWMLRAPDQERLTELPSTETVHQGLAAL